MSLSYDYALPFFSKLFFRIEIISEDEKSYHDTLNATLGGLIS